MSLQLVIGVLASLATIAHGARAPLASFQCGAPNSLCGASLPSGANCAAGYCQPGYFCGWNYSESDKTARCMPVPKNCGKAGNSCCPGNAAKPFTNSTSTGKPTCSDGSTCFYTPTPDASGWSAPAYSSPAGSLLGTCRRVSNDCGTLGKACCPGLYGQGTNPPLNKDICSGSNNFCQYLQPGEKGFDPNFQKGTCVANKPNCGTYGNSCCIQTSGVSTNALCGPQWPVQGYCAYPGGKATKDMRDQKCAKCPDKTVAAADPTKYFPCPSE